MENSKNFAVVIKSHEKILPNYLRKKGRIVFLLNRFFTVNNSSRKYFKQNSPYSYIFKTLIECLFWKIKQHLENTPQRLDTHLHISNDEPRRRVGVKTAVESTLAWSPPIFQQLPLTPYHLFAAASSICRCFVSYCVFTSALNGPISWVAPQLRGPALSEERLIGLLTTVGY